MQWRRNLCLEKLMLCLSPLNESPWRHSDLLNC